MPNNFEFECGTCGKEFPAGFQARENHCNSTGHRRPDFECDTCERWFCNQQACEQHMDATDHWFCDNESGYDDDSGSYDDYYYHRYYYEESHECFVCYDVRRTEKECLDHEVLDHYFCRPCDRFFNDHNAIRMHLNSRVHRGTNMDCPFCHRVYPTVTGVAQHIEAGACPSIPKLDRDAIFRIIKVKDPGGLLTKNLIGWYGSDHFEADARTWNGLEYECFLCHRGFGKLQSLQQHLTSPIHQQSLYHCPKKTCRKEFKVLGALLNHLESEACGYLKFDTVQIQAANMIRGGRLLCA